MCSWGWNGVDCVAPDVLLEGCRRDGNEPLGLVKVGEFIDRVNC